MQEYESLGEGQDVKRSYLHQELPEGLQKALEKRNIHLFGNISDQRPIMSSESWVTSEERKSRIRETFWTLLLNRAVYALLGSSTLFWCFLISIYLHMIFQMEGVSFWPYGEVISLAICLVVVSTMIFIIRTIAERRKLKRKEVLTSFKRGLLNGLILVFALTWAMVGLNALFFSQFTSTFTDSVFYLPFIFLPLAAILAALEYALYKERYKCPRAVRVKRLEILLMFLLALILVSFAIYVMAEYSMVKTKCAADFVNGASGAHDAD